MGLKTKKIRVDKDEIIEVTCDCCGKTRKCTQVPESWGGVYYQEIDDDVMGFSKTHDSLVCSPKCFIKEFEKGIKCMDEVNRGLGEMYLPPMHLNFAKKLIKYIKTQTK